MKSHGVCWWRVQRVGGDFGVGWLLVVLFRGRLSFGVVGSVALLRPMLGLTLGRNCSSERGSGEGSESVACDWLRWWSLGVLLPCVVLTIVCVRSDMHNRTDATTRSALK